MYSASGAVRSAVADQQIGDDATSETGWQGSDIIIVLIEAGDFYSRKCGIYLHRLL